MKQQEREAAFRKTMNFCRSRITLGRSFPGSTLSANGYIVSWHGGRATPAALGWALLLPPAWLTVRSIFESRGFETQQSQNCTTQRGCRTRGWLPEATCGVGGARWSFQSINYWELRHESRIRRHRLPHDPRPDPGGRSPHRRTDPRRYGRGPDRPARDCRGDRARGTRR